MRAMWGVFAFVLAWAASPSPARALTCLPVLGCTCDVVASDITFDDFNPLTAGQETAIGVIDITCGGVLSLGGGVVVEISQGAWGSYAARKMRSAAGRTIDYNIYTTGAHAQVWGSGAQAVVILTGVSLLQTWTARRDMFARLYASPAMHPGDYTDNVVVRVIW